MSSRPWCRGCSGRRACLITLALIAIARDLRAGHATGHGGHADRGRIVWLLALPIVLLTLVVPPALNARAAAPTTVMATSRPFPPLPGEGAPTVSLPEVLMRIATGAGGGLDNRSITVTGFTMKDGEHVDLAKIVIVCCAADAQLARLHLAGAGAPTALALPDNTWVRVEGTVPARPALLGDVIDSDARGDERYAHRSAREHLRVLNTSITRGGRWLATAAYKTRSSADAVGRKPRYDVASCQ